ncbi:MAG TPA: response regulator [Candidatus Acidoferrales bacterium]|nr:response regulator [Candidatus Acidoferrales bacterium]
MKILIIDDDQLTSTTWAMGLKSAGFEVVNASNGQEGINQTKSQKPDLVLLDQIMPDMLGNAVLATLKQDPETSSIPVMLISNYNENQMMKDAIAQGAVDYILKYQIETKDLVDKVQSLLSQLNRPGSAPAPSPAAAPEASIPSVPAGNLISPDTPGDNNNPTGNA